MDELQYGLIGMHVSALMMNAFSTPSTITAHDIEDFQNNMAEYLSLMALEVKNGKLTADLPKKTLDILSQRAVELDIPFDAARYDALSMLYDLGKMHDLSLLKTTISTNTIIANGRTAEPSSEQGNAADKSTGRVV